jgi:hypothetical protein
VPCEMLPEWQNLQETSELQCVTHKHTHSLSLSLSLSLSHTHMYMYVCVRVCVCVFVCVLCGIFTPCAGAW